MSSGFVAIAGLGVAGVAAGGIAGPAVDKSVVHVTDYSDLQPKFDSCFTIGETTFTLEHCKTIFDLAPDAYEIGEDAIKSMASSKVDDAARATREGYAVVGGAAGAAAGGVALKKRKST